MKTKRKIYLVFAPNRLAFQDLAFMYIDPKSAQFRGDCSIHNDEYSFRWCYDRVQLEGHDRESIVMFLPGWKNRYREGAMKKIDEINELCIGRYTRIWVDEDIPVRKP